MRTGISRVFAIALLCVALFSATGEAAFVGTYNGTFIGDNFGAFVVLIGPGGEIGGKAYSNKFKAEAPLQGQVAIDGTCQFWTAGREMSFTGTVDAIGRLMGKWVYSSGEGRGNFTALLVQ